VLPNFSILNGPGEAAVHNREVGGKGVQLRDRRQAAKWRSYLKVIGQCKNNISTNKTNKDGSLKKGRKNVKIY